MGNKNNNFLVVLDSLNGGNWRVHSEKITLSQTDRIIQCEGSQTSLKLGCQIAKWERHYYTGESILLRRIPRALYGRFDPCVFTFYVETETVFTLIIF